MATLKITQIKSRIGATAKQCANLDALGLRKINQSVTHSDSVIILGMIERVKHLVKVETVAEKATKKAAPKKAEAVVAEPVAEAAVAEVPAAEEKPAKKAPAKKPAAKKVTKTKKEE